jgi:hypothetical protein
VEYETGERELYNLRKDSYEMSNIARHAAKPLLRAYSRRLEALASCAGSECARWENDPLPKGSGGAAAERAGDDRHKDRTNPKGKKKNGKNSNRHRGNRDSPRS